jgi:DNA modification methylase
VSGARKIYESPRATLWLGDCRDVEVERQSCGLMATDPPYGVSFESNAADSKRFGPIAKDDGRIDIPAILGALVHWVNECRHVYVFGYDAATLAEPMQLAATADLIWDKGQIGMGDLSQPWGPQHEKILFGVHNPSRAHRARGKGVLAARLRRGSVITASRPCSQTIQHPTEKPVSLMRCLIESSSILGDRVFDPFCGVGSTLVAAILLGRTCVGIELDEGYATIAMERVIAAERLVVQMEAA